LREHTRALLAEIAGTFMFIVIGAGAIVTTVAAGSPPNGLLSIAFAHGLALAIAVSSFGAISGAHFNPAVTFGLAIAGKHPWSRVLTYWAAQLVGALAELRDPLRPGHGLDAAHIRGARRLVGEVEQPDLRGRGGTSESCMALDPHCK